MVSDLTKSRAAREVIIPARPPKIENIVVHAGFEGESMSLEGIQENVSTAPLEEELTQEELIEQVHEAFNTEGDRLLAEARILTTTDHIDHRVADKTRRLSELGFFKHKEKAAGELNARLESEALEANEKKALLGRAIDYFSEKYPLYKFITFESIETICTKYGLIMGPAENFTGFIPEKNLQEMENFKVDKVDIGYQYTSVQHGGSLSSGLMGWTDRQSLNHHEAMALTGGRDILSKWEDSCQITIQPESLQVAAPPKDFDMEGMELEGVVLRVKDDPVVFQPVRFEHETFYLIMTAWGAEASDPLVANEKLN